MRQVLGTAVDLNFKFQLKKKQKKNTKNVKTTDIHSYNQRIRQTDVNLQFPISQQKKKKKKKTKNYKDLLTNLLKTPSLKKPITKPTNVRTNQRTNERMNEIKSIETATETTETTPIKIN